MDMVTIGWIGGALLAFCAIPEAYNSWKRGRNDSSWFFLLSWFFGEIFTLIYVMDQGDLPLIVNYSSNILFIGIILKYKKNPRADNVRQS